MGFLCKTSTLISSTMLAYIVLYCCILLRRFMWMTSLWWLTSWITLVNEYPPIPRNHYNQSICRRVNWQLRKITCNFIRQEKLSCCFCLFMWHCSKCGVPVCFRCSQIQSVSPRCYHSHPEGHFDRQRWPLRGLLQQAIWSAQSSRCQAVVAVFDAWESRLSLLYGGKTTCYHTCQSDFLYKCSEDV